MFEIDKDVLIVKVGREVDHHNAEILRNNVEKKFKENDLKNIVFDFSKTIFMDSSGIGMCIGRYKLAKSVGGNFAVCNIGIEIRRIFDMAGLSKVFYISDTLDNAINGIKKEV